MERNHMERKHSPGLKSKYSLTEERWWLSEKIYSTHMVGDEVTSYPLPPLNYSSSMPGKKTRLLLAPWVFLSSAQASFNFLLRHTLQEQ